MVNSQFDVLVQSLWKVLAKMGEEVIYVLTSILQVNMCIVTAAENT